MKLSLKIIFWILLVGLLGCSSFKNGNKALREVKVAKINFVELQCVELSENWKLMSTGDDEILILFYLLDDDGTIVEKKHSDFMVFDSLNTLAQFSNQINIPNTSVNYSLKVILIEQDTDRSEQEIEDLVRININMTKQELKILLADDDLLDIKYLTIKNGYIKNKNELQFKGIHLFDKFEYKLRYVY